MYGNGEKILVVDDSEDIREVIGILLGSEGYTVTAVESGQQAVECLRAEPDFDLVILDIMLPEMSGTTACAEIRGFSSVPVLFLTALSGESDKVTAYATGGDDYLVKPFSGTELVMKVVSLLRRYKIYKGKDDKDDMLHVRSLSIRLSDKSVLRDDTRIQLTDKELAILLYLVRNRGRVVSTKELFEGVWHEAYMSTSYNSVMVHIMNLRRKIEDNANNPQIIRTVWGRGYTIAC